METKRLTKKEIALTEQLVSNLNANPELLDEELTQQFGDGAAEVRAALEDGVDQFYALYEGKPDKDALRVRLEENMQDMSPRRKYAYLANLLLALNQVCGSVVEGPEWRKMLELNRAVLAGLESEELSEDSPEIQSGIDEMLEQIDAQADAFAVLFIGEPPYERLMQECLTEDPAQVQALAANTRGNALHMAGALYLLQEQGQLKALEPGKISPRDMGVMAASLLEIDAAHKSGSWENAKSVIEKAAKAAATLLVASPDILEGTVMLALLYVMTSLSSLWLLIAGAILLVNAKVHLHNAKVCLEPYFQQGAKLLDTALDKVRDVCLGFRNWLANTVVPNALPVWQRARDYTMDHIILPTVDFVLNAKSRVLEAAGLAADKVRALFDSLKGHANRFGETVRNHRADVAPEAEILEAEAVEVEPEEEIVDDPSHDGEIVLAEDDPSHDEGEFSILI